MKYFRDGVAVNQDRASEQRRQKQKDTLSEYASSVIQELQKRVKCLEKNLRQQTHRVKLLEEETKHQKEEIKQLKEHHNQQKKE